MALLRVGVSRPNVRAIDVSALDASLLAAPAEPPFLAPLVKREIVYRLLRGEQGDRLQHIALQEGTTHHSVKAVKWLREAYD